jgi:3-hydroxyisobutyrate dehydrogenase
VEEQDMRIALLGTGTMGTGMARSMRRAGLDVTAWNRTKAKAEPLAADGITVAESVAEAVEGADAVVTMLFDADAVLSIADELLGARGDALWVQSSTVGVDGIARIAERAGGAALVDAPMLGTKEPAEQGKLVPLVSGEPALVERGRPVFDAVGAKTVVAGERIGDASALKLACNAWILSITVATAQSLALADGLGVAPELFLEAIEGGASDTPYAHMKGKAMLAGDFSPSFGLDGGRKDLGLIAEAAERAGVETGLVRSLRALYDSAADAGHGEDDLAAVFTALT